MKVHSSWSLLSWCYNSYLNLETDLTGTRSHYQFILLEIVLIVFLLPDVFIKYINFVLHRKSPMNVCPENTKWSNMESLHYGLRMPIEQKVQQIGKTLFIQNKSPIYICCTADTHWEQWHCQRHGSVPVGCSNCAIVARNRFLYWDICHIFQKFPSLQTVFNNICNYGYTHILGAGWLFHRLTLPTPRVTARLAVLIVQRNKKMCW